MKRGLRKCSWLLLLLFLSLLYLPIRHIQVVQAGLTVSTFYPAAGGDDGFVYGQSSVNYGTARSTATAANNFSTTATVGQHYFSKPSPTWYVYRGFYKINCAALPSYAIIIAANFSIYVANDFSTTDFTHNVQEWTGDTPINIGDYNQYDSTNYDDGTASSASGTGWLDIVLDDFDIIVKEGYTMICLRSSRDVSATAPTTPEYQAIATYESANDPKLVVTWATPYPQYSSLGVSWKQANTSATFHCNWTVDDPNNLSHWILGTNITGTFVNDTARAFHAGEELIANLTQTAATNPEYLLWNEHPSAATSWSGSGQGVTLRQDNAYNITAFEIKLRKVGSPNCNISMGIYDMTGTIPWSYPTTDWSPHENSTTIINATTLPASFAWYRFNFTGAFTMNPDSYYGFCIFVFDEITLDLSNYVCGQENGDDVYADGNQLFYASSTWGSAGVTPDLHFKLWGNYSSGSSTWSNSTKVLPFIVGQKVSYQFYANSTNNYWNTTGLQIFITVGINLTFYYTADGTFTIQNPSRCEGYINTANASAYGVANGSVLSLFGSPLNFSYYWLNFTWDSGNSLSNYANVTVILGMEGYDFWCYFNATPSAVWIVARFTFNVSNPEPAEAILFNATLSASSSSIDTYSWDFGDEAGGSGATAEHSYSSTGSYEVSLTVNGAAGSNVFNQTLTVASPSVEDYTSAGDLAEWVLAALIFGAIIIIAVAVILRRR